MLTRCPQCETVLRLDPKQLGVAEGLVRCGNCQSVFDGFDGLLPEEEYLVLSPLLGEEDARPAPTPATEPGASAPAPWARPRRSRRRWLVQLAWTVATLELLVVLLVVSGHFYTAQMAAYLPLRPMLERICRTTGCVVPPRRAPELITVRDRVVRTHPHKRDALLAQVVMVNEAPFPQPYPVVELTLTRLDGVLAGSRRFTPEEYLGEGDPPKLMAPGTAVTVELELVDPGNVTGFRFRFL